MNDFAADTYGNYLRLFSKGEANERLIQSMGYFNVKYKTCLPIERKPTIISVITLRAWPVLITFRQTRVITHAQPY